MRRRSYLFIFWGIYLVVILSIDIIIPRLFPSHSGIVDFIPFFFFFPFVSLGRRRQSQNGGASPSSTGSNPHEGDQDSYVNSNMNDYSDFGLSPRKRSYMPYYIGIGIFIIGIVALLYFYLH